MSNIEKLKFPALDIIGANYIQWTGYVKRHLKSMGVISTIQEGNKCTEETKAKADVLLHQYIDEMLEFEICRTLRFYGQTVTEGDMLEKTFSTFHASNINLQQQYRLQNFKRYYDLNVNLLVAEKNNELLMKNHQSRPTGSLAIQEANAVNNNDNKNSRSKRGRGNPRWRGHDRGHYGHNRFPNRKYSYHRGGYNGCGRGRGQRNNTYHAPQVNNLNQKSNKVGSTKLIDGVGKANVVLPNGTQLLIDNALFSLKSKRNLLSFRCIYHNGYDTQSRTIGNKKYLHIINENQVFEKLPMLYFGLHYTHINVPQAHMAVKEKYCDHGIFSLWHDKLGHPRSTMMKRIVENTHGHPLKDQKFSKMIKVPLCISCFLIKLIVRPSPLKIENESPMFLERIQGDICGPIHPPCGPFRYFMVLIDASITCLIIINSQCGLCKISSDYCMSVGIVVEHPVAHVYTQNGLAESLIKRLQLIARPLIMRTKLHVSMWGHAILQAALLIRMRPSADHKYSPIQLASGQEPNISHLRIFCCAVYVEPLTDDVFTTRFADYHFNEAIFPPLGEEKKTHEKDLPDVFTDTKRVTKSHIPAANAPTRVEIPNKQAGNNIAQESQKRLKRGRRIGSKDKNPRKRKGTEKNSNHDENVLDETQDIKTSLEEEMNDMNKDMSINYSQTNILWDQNEIGDIDEIFSYFVASDIMSGDDDPEPKSVIDCQSRPDWGK
ncbi:disease resistance CC-NBS-LRR class family protein [Tanacetum coccineum]